MRQAQAAPRERPGGGPGSIPSRMYRERNTDIILHRVYYSILCVYICVRIYIYIYST